LTGAPFTRTEALKMTNTPQTVAGSPDDAGLPEQLYSIESVAKILDCSPKTVRRKIAAKKLDALRDDGRLKVTGNSLVRRIKTLPRVS
jgi:hypothetical protein